MSGAWEAFLVSPSQLWRWGRDILVNIALPFLIYGVAQPRFGDVNALLASSAPPILWSVVECARHRRIDALSALVLAGIALSILAFLGGGSVRFLQFREKIVTVLIALVFLGSAALGRPLMYEIIRAFLARTRDPELRRVESLRDNSFFRRVTTIMTLVWGAGLFADAAVSAALLFVLPIRAYLVVNPILGYATIGGLTLWNIWFGKKARREGEARMAAAQLGRAPNL
jgi:intracellular septation protein A